MLGWAFDDEEPRLWQPHLSSIPDELERGIRDPRVIKYAYNAAFERQISTHVLGVHTPPEAWRCNMVAASYLGFTGGLGKTLEAIGLSDKDKRGGQLINIFCSPAAKSHKADWYDYKNRPKEWQEFCRYCLQDVRVERELYHYLKKFPVMPSWDWKQWFLDQRINDRGVLMDVEMAESAISMWIKEVDNLKQQLADITGLPKVTRDPFLKYLKDTCGVELENTRREYLEGLVRDGDLPEKAEQLISLWMQKEAKAASKYQAVINATGPDGRARGMFQYKGAARTDRVGGRVIQLQNLKRPFVDSEDILELVDDIKRGAQGD